MHTRFIELAGEINSSMPDWVVNKVSDALNSFEKSLKNSKILVLGLAYKRNVEDVRESPSIEIMELLQSQGAVVSYSDPHVPTFPAMRAHSFDLHSVSLSADVINAYDCVILTTAHDAFDYDLIAHHARMIVDTRGAFKRYQQHNIVSA